MKHRFKIWLVRRWLGCLDNDELIAYTEDRRLREQVERYFQHLGERMIGLFYND
jgi:hypothetical protein